MAKKLLSEKTPATPQKKHTCSFRTPDGKEEFLGFDPVLGAQYGLWHRCKCKKRKYKMYYRMVI